jgi:hypothetical protein
MLVGTEAVRIVDHECVLKTQVEAVALTTYDPYTIAKAQTKQAIALLHGTVVGRKFQLDLPSCQQLLPSYQEQSGIAEWPPLSRPCRPPAMTTGKSLSPEDASCSKLPANRSLPIPSKSGAG